MHVLLPVTQICHRVMEGRGKSGTGGQAACEVTLPFWQAPSTEAGSPSRREGQPLAALALVVPTKAAQHASRHGRALAIPGWPVLWRPHVPDLVDGVWFDELVPLFPERWRGGQSQPLFPHSFTLGQVLIFPL